MTDIPDRAAFAHVTDWVFDLDNTLYPHAANLFSQIDVKMTSYVETLLKLPRDEARKIQKQFYLEYGTTLKGLMECHQIDPDDFLRQVRLYVADARSGVGTGDQGAAGSSLHLYQW